MNSYFLNNTDDHPSSDNSLSIFYISVNNNVEMFVDHYLDEIGFNVNWKEKFCFSNINDSDIVSIIPKDQYYNYTGAPMQLYKLNDGLYYVSKGFAAQCWFIIRYIKYNIKIIDEIDDYILLKTYHFFAEVKDEYIHLNNNLKSDYYYFNLYQKKLISIHISDFRRRELPIWEFGKIKVKYEGTKHQVYKMLNKNRDHLFIRFKSENGLLEIYDDVFKVFADLLKGVSLCCTTFYKIGHYSNYCSDIYTDFKNKYLSPITIPGFDILKKYGFRLVQLISSVLTLFRHKFDLISFAPLIINVVEMFTYFHSDVTSSPVTNFKSESLDSILVAGLGAVLPECILTILKKMQIITSRKILDDSSMLLDFLSMLSSIINAIIDLAPLCMREYLISLMSTFGLEEYVIIEKIKKLYLKWDKNKKIIVNADFRKECKLLQTQIRTIDIKRFFAKNKVLSDLAGEFSRLIKAIDAYESTSRTEPCCFFFEGRPGTMKSVTMNGVIQALGWTHYAHTIPCTEDGKDFYDAYNNEEIFYVDDMGAAGKSQFRYLVNWVSCQKSPLTCAEASLKDTKYFNSSTILITTNNFQYLQGFTAKDCIETPDALWRRGYIFDYNDVKGVGHDMTGFVKFKYFDVTSKSFIHGFPRDFSDYLNLHGVQLKPECIVDIKNDLLIWMCTIISGFKKMKDEQKVSNDLVDSDIDMIRKLNPFHSESNIYLDTFKEYTAWVMERLSTFVGDALLSVIQNPLLSISGLGLSILFSSLLFRCQKDFNSEGGFVSSLTDTYEGIDTDHCHSLIPKITESVHNIAIAGENNILKHCFGVVSERFIVAPLHLLDGRDQVQLIIYKDKDKNHRLIDHSLVDVVYRNTDNDVCIMKLSDGFPTPFKKISHCFGYTDSNNLGLVFPKKVVKLEGLLQRTNGNPIYYNIANKRVNSVKNPVIYKDLHFEGMCGVPLITENGHIKGMHIAGANDPEQLGVSLVWDESCREDIYKVLNKIDSGLKLDVIMCDKIRDNMSCIKIKSNFHMSTPKNTNFIKSPLYDLFETTRSPANLTIFGNHTIKDLAKGSMENISSINLDELNYAKSVLSLYMVKYKDLSEREIILGNEKLARVNKKSSNGIFTIKDKLDCLDYENGIFKDDFKKLYIEFENRMRTGDIKLEDIIWTESIKDELKNNEKLTPRSFKISPLPMQILTKKIFGNLVSHIVDNRWFNEIMIGINPFKEWHKLYNHINYGREWGGDISKYDKQMKVQVQLAVADVLLSFYEGQEQQLAKNILCNIPYSVVAVNDDVYMLNHSLPSGCWLTAMFNSLVNRTYTLMWYYRYMKKENKTPTVVSFFEDISDPVYGDDRLNSCKKKEYAHFLNAITMKDFFESMGMKMTDSLKNEIVTPFQPIKELTFLKRYFRFHPILKTIVCPLDLRTVYSTLSWIDGSKDDLENVLQDKINNFQREIFLHYELYHSAIAKLTVFCNAHTISFTKLPIEYLQYLYENDFYDEDYHKAYGLLR